MNKKHLIHTITGLALVSSLITAGNVGAAKWRGTAGGQVRASEAAANSEQPKASVDQAAVNRTRKQVQMLDDLYKTAVVLITEHYVENPASLSGATAAKALFATMKKNGWHDVRIIGFTDVLFRPDENSPKDEFEETAKTKLLGGAATHEEVITDNGKQYLRIATQLPVVMEKCAMCHANFKDNKDVIGALSYIVPLID
ncbi:MAG: DUF3365 domain-containing protein [Methylococcales bacterium]